MTDYEGGAVGGAMFLVGAGWLALTEMRWFRETTVARTLGVATALVGAQVAVTDGTHSWLGYALTVLVAVVGIAVYLRNVAWPYLAGAVIAVTLVVPEAITDWTDGSIGAIGAVLIAGVTLAGRLVRRLPGACRGDRLRRTSARYEPIDTRPVSSFTVTLMGFSWAPRVMVHGSEAPTFATTKAPPQSTSAAAELFGRVARR